MITGMLDKAFETISNGTGLIFHSDQGWQYQKKYYCQILKQKRYPAEYDPKGQLSR